MPVREMVTVTEAARRLGVSRQTIHDRTKSADLYVEEYGEHRGKRAAFLLVDMCELLALWPQPETVTDELSAGNGARAQLLRKIA